MSSAEHEEEPETETEEAADTAEPEMTLDFRLDRHAFDDPKAISHS